MATVTKSIGTSSRDHSTITLWEGALDGGSYASGDVAVGECYNDSAFSESATVTIDGGGTVGLASRTLSVASGQRHTGIASTGAVFRPATTGKGIVLSIANTTLEWLDIDENALSINSTVSSTVISTIQRCIVRGAARSTATGSHLIGIAATSGAAVTINVHNNLVYALTETGTGAGFTIGINDAGSATRPFNANNNTVYNLINDGGTGGVTMLSFTDGSGKSIRNNLCVTNSGTGSGAKACYPTTSASAFATNLSSDTSGTSGLTSKTAANQFVATTGGSEDLHLKAGADAIGVGTDLVTTPSGVQFDIDGYDRDTTGVTWDAGADQYVASGGSYSLSVGISAAASVTESVSATMAISGAIAAVASVSDSISLTIAISNSMAASANVAESPSLTISSAISLAGTAAFQAAARLIVSQSVALAGAGGFAVTASPAYAIAVQQAAAATFASVSRQTFTQACAMGATAAFAESIAQVHVVAISLAIQAAIDALVVAAGGGGIDPSFIKLLREAFTVPTLTSESLTIPRLKDESFLA